MDDVSFGWAQKKNQEMVLAIRIDRSFFEELLFQAVYTSYHPEKYSLYDEWKQQLKDSNVRLQWDPDHDPLGKHLARRAIQIGIKGKALEKDNQHIVDIEDITSFVRRKRAFVEPEKQSSLILPKEEIDSIEDDQLAEKIGLDHT